MRIFIEPPYEAQSIKAFEVLREAGVASARTGESISNQAVVLVDLPDLAKALAVFGKAEMRAVWIRTNSNKPGLYGRDQ